MSAHHEKHPPEHGHGSESSVSVFIVTCSDTRTLETDTSGGKIAELLSQAGHTVVERLLLNDDPAPFAATLIDLLNRANVDAILTTGGTGISRRDQSVDVIEQLIEQPLPGFGELFRQLSYTQIGSGGGWDRQGQGDLRDAGINRRGGVGDEQPDSAGDPASGV